MRSTHIRICSAKHPVFYASIVSESPNLFRCLFWLVGSPLVRLLLVFYSCDFGISIPVDVAAGVVG